MKNEYYDKFPALLKSKLENEEIQFPTDTQFIYESFKAFRGIEREPDDTTPVNREDMRSHPELGRPLPRGKSPNDPDWYSTSLNTDIDRLKLVLRFPKPNKKIALGTVYQEGGPQYLRDGDTHVSWWVFEELDVSDFVICED